MLGSHHQEDFRATGGFPQSYSSVSCQAGRTVVKVVRVNSYYVRFPRNSIVCLALDSNVVGLDQPDLSMVGQHQYAAQGVLLMDSLWCGMRTHRPSLVP